MEMVMPKLPQLLTTALGFLFFVWILAKFAWGPILGLLDERRGKIDGDYAAAEKNLAEAEQLKGEFELKLADIKTIQREMVQEAVKKGEKAKKGTGPCKISTRDGLIDIELKNGRTFNLKPTQKDNVYKDQEGKKVVRSEESTKSTRFKWDHAGITVTWKD